MIKKAIDRIIELSAPETATVKGKEFAKDHLTEVRPHLWAPGTVTVSSLTSLVDLVKEEAAEIEKKLFVNIISPTRIEVFSEIDTVYMERTPYYNVEPARLPFHTGSFSHEQFVIMLRSACVQNENTENLLKSVATIKMDEGVTSKDNGVSQEVMAKKGISLQEKATINPRVTLTPYRTFLEVEQPSSEFLFRLTEGMNIILTEADGGAWMIAAKQNIYDYLVEAFVNEAGRVIVLR